MPFALTLSLPSHPPPYPAGQVLRCLRSLMNLEQGMEAMLGLHGTSAEHDATASSEAADDRSSVGRESRAISAISVASTDSSATSSAVSPLNAGRESHALAGLVSPDKIFKRRKQRTGLRQLALCADGKRPCHPSHPSFYPPPFFTPLTLHPFEPPLR